MYYPTYGTYAAPGGITPRADMQPQPMTQPTQQEQRQEHPPAFVPLQDFLGLKNDLDDVKAELEKLKKSAGRTAKKEEPANE